MALLVAIALFIAQSINFGLLVKGSNDIRFAQLISPAAARLADASERLTAQGRLGEPPRNGLRRPGGRGERADGRRDGRRPFFLEMRARVDAHRANPLPGGKLRHADIESALRQGMANAGFYPKQVIAIMLPIDPNSNFLKRLDDSTAKWIVRHGAELQVAVERQDGQWLSLRTGWTRMDYNFFWPVLAQTLILYIVVLVPVLWAGRRIARPLRSLAAAARGFTPGDGAQPLEERGSSDIRSVIAAYNSLSRRVSGMLEEKDRMLGAIGHDLRTPLAALRVRIESVEDDEDRARMADTIDEMNRTLDDILSLARLGRPSEPATDVDLSALIDAVVEDFRDLDQPVEFEEAPRLAMRLRPSLMRRAVRNLIENAVKYGGVAEVRLVPGTSSVAIEVADRGPGIPEAQLEAVFDPFTRLETSRNRDTGGIGLGLALARAIVRDAGGDIRLRPRDGGGLVATISLPRG